ncbi:MAG: threonine synthase [Thermoproteota archaeon]
MSLANGLFCTRCGRQYDLDNWITRCYNCNGTLVVGYDYRRIGRSFKTDSLLGIWRYSKLLPVMKQENMVSLGEGLTFLHRCDRTSRELGIKKVYIKDESTNPTGSFLDRGVAVDVSKALELGYGRIKCHASGNLGASLAAYAAKAGIDCTITLSGKVDVGKFYQMIAYGANIEFKDKLDEADYVSGEGLLILETNSPYFLDGLKTTGYEIVEQLDWKLPDRIMVPMGSGAHISMIWRSLKELCEIKAITSMDTMLCGVQASGCAPIVKAFLDKKEDVTPLERVETSIIDIAVKAPTEGQLALRSIRDSKGTAIAVSDSEVLEAAKILAREEGIFAEPAGASTVAGLRKLVKEGQVGRDEEVVCIITGMGLKDPRSARSFIERSREMERFVRAMETEGFVTRLGETKLRILKLLSKNEQYGYTIWMNLGKIYHTKISIPSIYQHLSELEMSGLIQRTRSQRISGKPERRYYAITARGRSILVQAEKMERTSRNGL